MFIASLMVSVSSSMVTMAVMGASQPREMK